MKPFDLTQLSVLSLVIKSLVPFLISLPSKTALPFDSSHLLVQDSPGLRWDAIHYASIALDGYRYEQQGAFMPLWLGMMRLSGEVLAYLRGRDSVGVGEVLLGGQYLNILMNAGAVMMLYKLTRFLYPSTAFTSTTTLLYVLAPTPAASSAPYTEPSYAFYTFLGFYLAVKDNWIMSSLALSLATGVRATGVFSIAILGWRLIFGGDMPGRKHVNIKRMTPRLLIAIPLCLIVIAPFLAFQYYVYLSLCRDTETTRPWCASRIPLPYTFIQAEYWNVGFLKYWTLAQIPNLLIAGPILLPALSGSYIYLRNLLSPRIKVQQVNPALLPFHLYSLHQTLLLIFSAHTQVALRVAATNPVIWWNLAEMSFDWSEAAPRKMRKLGKVWVAWSIVWGAVSIVLWSGHYPPA